MALTLVSGVTLTLTLRRAITLTLGPLTLGRAMILALRPLSLGRAMTLALRPLSVGRPVTLSLWPLLPLLPSRRPAIPVAVAITVAARGRWAGPDASVGVGRARFTLRVGVGGHVRFAADPIGLELVVPASHSVKPSGKGPLRGRGFLD
jgi:hypothetical protein